MKRLAALVAVVFFLAASFPLASQAQMESESKFQVGPRVTLDLGDISDFYDGTFAIGGDVRYDPAQLPVKGSGAFDYYFAADNTTVFTIDVNVLYPFDAGESFAPYVGAGLGYTDVSVDVNTGFGNVSGGASDTGLNLVGGAEFETGGSLTPFAEARFTLGDLDRFGITGGVLFNL
jgi:opacity protein-like surface antigen